MPGPFFPAAPSMAVQSAPMLQPQPPATDYLAQASLLQRLARLGSMPERQRALEQRLALANNLLTPGRQYGGSVAGAIGGGIGDILRSVAGMKLMGDVGQQQEQMGTEQTGAAEELGKQIQQPVSLPTGATEGTADATAMKAYNDAIQHRLQLGETAALAGPQSSVGRLGEILTRGAQHSEEMLARLTEAATQRKAMQEFREEQLRTTKNLREEQLEQTKALRMSGLNLQSGKVAYDPNTGKFFRVYGGTAQTSQPSVTPPPTIQTATPGAPAPSATTTQEEVSDIPRGGKDAQRWFQLSKEFNQTTDPVMARGGLKDIFGTIASAKQLKALVKDPNDPTGMTPQQMYELTIGLQRLVSRGHVSEKEVEALLPRSLWGDAVRGAQYFADKPLDVGQKAWAKNMLETAQREEETNKKTIDDVIKTRIPGTYQQMYQMAPKAAANMLRGKGLDPDAFTSGGLVKPGREKSYHLANVIEERTVDGKTIQKMDDGSLRLKP